MRPLFDQLNRCQQLIAHKPPAAMMRLTALKTRRHPHGTGLRCWTERAFHQQTERCQRSSEPFQYTSQPSHSRPGQFKRFTRELNESGDFLWRLNNRPTKKEPLTGPVRTKDFYQISDLLLDLDAEGSRAARPYTEEDGEMLSSKWAIDNEPLWKEVSERVRLLHNNLTDWRKQRQAVHTDHKHAWRVTFHDLLSAALLSPDATAHSRQQLARAHSLHYPVSPLPDVHARLCVENGIPGHALESSSSFLRWLLLCRRSVDRQQLADDGTMISPESFVWALEAQDSVRSIRRLVLESISAGVDLILCSRGQGMEFNLAEHIRAALTNCLFQRENATQDQLETVVFIGNLHRRYADREGADQHAICALAPLWGLALRLSVQLCEFRTASEYLRRAMKKEMWAREGVREDVLLALTSCLELVTDRRWPQLQDAKVREQLFTLLTGFGEERAPGSVSFRGLVLSSLRGAEEISPTHAFSMFANYMKVLGSLGATNTLWYEWSANADTLRWWTRRAKGQSLTVGAIMDVLTEALRASKLVAGPPAGCSAIRGSLIQSLEADVQLLKAHRSPVRGAARATLDPETEQALGKVNAFLREI